MKESLSKTEESLLKILRKNILILGKIQEIEDDNSLSGDEKFEKFVSLLNDANNGVYDVL